jgi:hypothetical protein
MKKRRQEDGASSFAAGLIGCRRDPARPCGVGQAGTPTSARPEASWGRSTHSTLQPRASRPPSGEKWVQDSDWEPGSIVRRQPQTAQVTGPPATHELTRGQAGWESVGWIIGCLSIGSLGELVRGWARASVTMIIV